MYTKYAILGAGIGGLSVAAELKRQGEDDFLILDGGDSLPLNLQNGVHYLHSIPKDLPFDFEFKSIRATEEIWNPRKDEFKTCANLPEMIDYSMKVMNIRHPSSIMDPGNRDWETIVPADNNMNSLLETYQNFIGPQHFRFKHYVEAIHYKSGDVTIHCYDKCIESKFCISTLPLNNFTKRIHSDTISGFDFDHKPIYINNHKINSIVPNWLISLYISDPDFPVYRITILNGIISMESLRELTHEDRHIVRYHLKRYFDYDFKVEEARWDTGRIWGINKEKRKIICNHFLNRRVYFLGRYGLWNGKLTMDSTIEQAQLTARAVMQRAPDYMEKIIV